MSTRVSFWIHWKERGSLINKTLLPSRLLMFRNSYPTPRYFLFRPLFSRCFQILASQWVALNTLLSHYKQVKVGPEIMLLLCMESEDQDHSCVYICFSKRFFFTQYWVERSKTYPEFEPSIFSSKSAHCFLYYVYCESREP